jgi:protein-S-isoprenylcysteine O-methyltransferase Ste14
MALSNELQAQGDWLFRWRSYLPLVLLSLLAIAMKHPQFPFGSLELHEVWEEVCLGISFLGLLVRATTIGYTPALTSGRNTKCQIADTLNTTGMYSIVRHPLYLGNFLIGFGIVLVCWVWWLPAIYSLVFLAYYERIMFAEEAFLHRRFGEEFERWAASTPAFWPRFSQWRRPALPFSFRNVLRREYTGLLVVVAGHSSIEFAEHFLLKNYGVQPFWMILACGGVGGYLALRALKKHTTLLNVPGR